MNTHLSVKPQSSNKPALLATQQQKTEREQQNSQTSTGKRTANLGLRYPEELERCFVLGNN